MIPATLNKGTRSNAESLLFPLLRERLSSNYTVMHSFFTQIINYQILFLKPINVKGKYHD